MAQTRKVTCDTPLREPRERCPRGGERTLERLSGVREDASQNLVSPPSFVQDTIRHRRVSVFIPLPGLIVAPRVRANLVVFDPCDSLRSAPRAMSVPEERVALIEVQPDALERVLGKVGGKPVVV